MPEPVDLEAWHADLARAGANDPECRCPDEPHQNLLHDIANDASELLAEITQLRQEVGAAKREALIEAAAAVRQAFQLPREFGFEVGRFLEKRAAALAGEPQP